MEYNKHSLSVRKQFFSLLFHTSIEKYSTPLAEEESWLCSLPPAPHHPGLAQNMSHPAWSIE